MVEAGVLLKLLVEGQAIIYKVIQVQTTAVKAQELCSIARGKMTINYRKRIESHIFQSDIGTRYKIVNTEELNMMLEILKNTMVEVGY